MEIKEFVKLKKQALTDTINNLVEKPHLLIIQVNNDEASNAYVKGKKKDLDLIGARCTHLTLPLDITEQELLNVIKMNNYNDDVDGILVQMPLPKHINETKVKETISPVKDVDGFHPLSKCIPCTPKGIIDYLKAENVEFNGKNAVVIGRSNIVGKPMALLLLEKNGTVTICHSRTNDLLAEVKAADILIVAVGRPEFITGDMLKPGCVVVDVGINRTQDGRLVGDVEFGSASSVAAYISPVPGGVGPMTITTLLQNTLTAAKNIVK